VLAASLVREVEDELDFDLLDFFSVVELEFEDFLASLPKCFKGSDRMESATNVGGKGFANEASSC